MNRAEEDYLKTIYELTYEKNQELIKTNELSLSLGFTDQSVNEMIKKLVGRGLVDFYPYKGLKLTNEGRLIAIQMIRAHRIWEVFLTEKLHFSWADVHEDAEKLEHISTPKILNRLYEYLGRPTHCQHGNPIPDESLEMHEYIEYHTLLDYQEGDLVQITRVLDHKNLLRFLDQKQVKLYDNFAIMKKDNFSQMMEVMVNNQTIMISYTIASMLYVKKMN